MGTRLQVIINVQIIVIQMHFLQHCPKDVIIDKDVIHFIEPQHTEESFSNRIIYAKILGELITIISINLIYLGSIYAHRL